MNIPTRLQKLEVIIKRVRPYDRPGGPERFRAEVPEAWDCYARLMEMAATVAGIDTDMDYIPATEEEQAALEQACHDLPDTHPEAMAVLQRLSDLINEWE